jgi:penicillin-binding protein 1A
MLKRILVTVGLLGAAGAAAGAAWAFYALRDLPRLHSMQDYRPAVMTRVFDRNGELMARFFKERRTVVARAEIPQRLIDAFLAAEDADFYQHGGVDPQGLVAAVVREVGHKLFRMKRRGGSTITQQTAKTFLLTPTQTYARKLREMVLAYRIEGVFAKDEILFLYLNQIYFGNGAYGIEEAAQTYFGKGVGELTLAECAVLASIPKSPNTINPIYNPNRTLERRGYVLTQMAKRGLISSQEAAEAQQEPLLRERPAPEYLNRTPYYAEEIRRELVRRFGEEAVYHDGFTAYAAADARTDVVAQRALHKGLVEVDRRRGWRGPLLRVDPDVVRALGAALDRQLEERLPRDTRERSTRIWDLGGLDAAMVRRSVEEAAAHMRIVYRDEGELVGVLVHAVDSAAKVVHLNLGTTRAVMTLDDMKWARSRRPDGTLGPVPKDPVEVLRAGDVVLVRLVREQAVGTNGGTVPAVVLEQAPQVQGAVVAVEPETHRVRALVGGSDFSKSSFNRATQAHRQPGSAFKPLIYAAALQSRQFTPATLMVDAPKVFDDHGKDYKPENSDGKFLGDLRLRDCLTYSRNICSFTLVETLTPKVVLEIANRFGLGKDWPPVLSLALGTGLVTPLAMANAYATLADEGSYSEPTLLEKVKNAQGEVLFETEQEKRSALDPATSYVTLSMMKSVVEEGTGRRIKDLGRPVAGKTGTTQDHRDAWFVGCVPGLCTAVWVGMDDDQPLGSEEGGRAAAPVYLAMHQWLLEGVPTRDFVRPPGVIEVVIDRQSGLLAAEGQANALQEVFLDGTAPTELVDLSQTGRPVDWTDDGL